MTRNSRTIKEALGEHFTLIEGTQNAVLRIAPPEGSIKYEGKSRDMSMAFLKYGSDFQSQGAVAVEQLAVIGDDVLGMNLNSTLTRYGELGVYGVITSSFRTAAGNYAAGGVEGSDHTRGLALDVAYGNYYNTRISFTKIINANSDKKFIRQIIFENIRGTSNGYHIHIGFYVPSKTGPIESTLWLSKIKGNKYNTLRSATMIPRKEVFEDA